MTPRTWNTNIALAAGVAVGLIIGLFIGWVLWPVQWQGAALNELFPDAKAHYLSAIAEAYTMYDSPQAAATAQQRLAAFGDNLGPEIESAIAFYSNSSEPDKEIRISNLTRLAQALEVDTPNLVGLAQSNQTPLAQADSSAETADGPSESAADTEGMSWLQWLIYLLLAVMLVLAGIYILLRVSRNANRAPDDDRLNEMIDERIGALNDRNGAWMERIRNFVNPTPAAKNEQVDEKPSNAPWRPMVSAALAPNEQEDYAFDEEPDEPTTTRVFSGKPNVVQASHFSRVPIHDNIDTEESDFDDLANGLDDELDNDEDAAIESSALHAPYQAASDSSAAPGTAPSTAEHSRTKSTETPLAPPAVNSPRSESNARLSGFSTRNAKYKLLEVYTAEYQTGMRDYDEAHGITDIQTSKYIGECGMGTSAKNGLLQNNPDHVVALEVWLFDKTDERNMGSQTRVLLSEYAVDHNLEQAFLKERQDDPRPFTAQPNVQFDLESQNLLLKCVIVEAVYMPSGPAKGTFQSVKVEMHVHKKT